MESSERNTARAAASKPEMEIQAAPAADEKAARGTPVFQDSAVFQWANLSLRTDLTFIVGIALCLAVGLAAGHPSAGMIAASGAMIVGFGAKQSIDDSRLLPMIFASLGITFSTFVGMISGHDNVALVAIVAVWGFGYGLLSVREGYAWVAQQSVVYLLVASAFPFSVRAALVRSALLLAGGFVQILSTSAMLRMFTELKADLLSVARYARQEQVLLRSTMAEALRSMAPGEVLHRALPFAVRVAVVLAVGTEIYRRLHFASGYWIPMTALLVLKPDLRDTVSRAIARTVGTVAGAALITLLVARVPLPPVLLAVFTVLFAWLCYATLNVNYALFSLLLTGYIVFLLALNALPEAVTAERRAVSTVIGGGLALIVRVVMIRWRRGAQLAPGEIAP